MANQRVDKGEWNHYDIETAATLDELAEAVNAMIKAGYRPVGGPFVADGRFCQAMIRG
jgi:hypothetical protein